MHITRVRSCKIDNWTHEELDLMQSIGNDRANQYWEGKNNTTGFSKPSGSANATQRKSFIKEKYVKKVWADPVVGNPVELYHKALEKGVNPAEYIKAQTGHSTSASKQTDSKVTFKKPELSKVNTQGGNGGNNTTAAYFVYYQTET